MPQTIRANARLHDETHPPHQYEGNLPMSQTRTTANGVPVRGQRPIRPGLFMVVFCLGLFMTLLDITIVNIATPTW